MRLSCCVGRVVGIFQRNQRDIVATIVGNATDGIVSAESDDTVLAIPMDARLVG